MDPRIPPIVEKLFEHHAPGKLISEITPEIREMAEAEARLLLEVLDSLRPPDIMVLANRQIERISAWAKQQQLTETIELLREEINAQNSERFEHLKSGLQWAVELLGSQLASRPKI